MARPYSDKKPKQVLLRVPDAMRDELQACAEQNGRTFTAEVMARLERSLREPASMNSAELEAWKRSIEWRLAQLEGDPADAGETTVSLSLDELVKLVRDFDRRS